MVGITVGKHKYFTMGANESQRVFQEDLSFIGGVFSRRKPPSIFIGWGSMNLTYNSSTIEYFSFKKQMLDALDKMNTKSIYILGSNVSNLQGSYLKGDPRSHVGEIHPQHYPVVKFLSLMKKDLDIKIINVDKYKNDKAYAMAWKFYETLKNDHTFILKHADLLSEYRQSFVLLNKTKKENQAFQKELDNLAKQKSSKKRVIGMNEISQLNFFTEGRIVSGKLFFDIPPHPLQLSTEIGKVYTAQSFERNPVLYELAKHLYTGGTFMGPTATIGIQKNLQPFIANARGSDPVQSFLMDRFHWGGIGFAHIGTRYTCLGGFNDFVVTGHKHDLLYYCLGLKQYLTTINMEDMAGRRAMYFDVYKDGQYVFNAGVEKVRNYLIQNKNSVPSASEIYKMTEKAVQGHMQFKEFLLETSCDSRSVFETVANAINYQGMADSQEWGIAGQKNIDSFLEVLKIREPEIYKQVIERKEKIK